MPSAVWSVPVKYRSVTLNSTTHRKARDAAKCKNVNKTARVAGGRPACYFLTLSTTRAVPHLSAESDPVARLAPFLKSRVGDSRLSGTFRLDEHLMATTLVPRRRHPGIVFGLGRKTRMTISHCTP